MALDTSLYNLNKNAFDIITDAYDRLAEIASEAIDCEGSRKQPRLLDHLVMIGLYYDQVMEHLVLNQAETAVIGIIKEDVSVVNQLLIQLKTLTDKTI